MKAIDEMKEALDKRGKEYKNIDGWYEQTLFIQCHELGRDAYALLGYDRDGKLAGGTIVGDEGFLNFNTFGGLRKECLGSPACGIQYEMLEEKLGVKLR